SERKNYSGAPFNESEILVNRGGNSIDKFIQTRKPPHSSTNGTIDWKDWKEGICRVVDRLRNRPPFRQACTEHGLTEKMYKNALQSFRNSCLDISMLDPKLVEILRDNIHGKSKDVDQLFPFFLSHAKRIFPHLESMEELRNVSDLRQPHNWYPVARAIKRKIFFHAGPTNSGKTYHALKRFRESKSGVFCGPLKLLVSEVYTKMNMDGLNMDMITGEERRFAVDNLHPSDHISCTVEMLPTAMRVEVAVIDEIQMLRDEERGWAWTRALLGVAADEVHLCGEVAAIPIVKKLLEPIGETVK
ncbi:hypothetical protein PMAYCL1PPCAC_01760, partial [Pristionchus mayeri]